MCNKVKIIRLLRGLSQIELAKRAKISTDSLSLVERGLN